jgi:predicted nucleic acid-binding protein
MNVPRGGRGKTADTSVVVPALLIGHEAHDRCDSVLAETDAVIGHVIVETYSVLTRLPYPLTVPPAAAAEALARWAPDRIAVLDATAYASTPVRLASAGLAGGSVYDALIALTAIEHDLRLITRDARAARTYRSLGVAFQLVP